MKSFKSFYYFIKKEAVLCIAGMIAIISMFFIPPSLDYFEYIDFRVLALLFCLMAVVAGFNKIGIFQLLAEKLLLKTKSTRSLSYVLILLCFFTSMWITNDVALITFVPFVVLLLTLSGQTKQMIIVIVLQTIAANLGSMLTPVGNPQNLYLYSIYDIPIMDFIQITLPVTAVSFLLLSAAIFLIKNEPLDYTLPKEHGKIMEKKRAGILIVIYSILFLICLLSVLRIIDYRITFGIVLISVLIFDRDILKRIDYTLLLTFLCFFVFVGNFGSISAVKDFLGALMSGKELMVSLIVSQGISNVPAAVLLSAFTDNSRDLILGTNIGGLGTLIASLASLISYKLYCKTKEAKPLKFLGVFTIYNGVFLILLVLFSLTILRS